MSFRFLVMNTWSPQCPQPFVCSLTLLLLFSIILLSAKTLCDHFFLSSQCFNWISPRGNKPCTTAKLTLMFSITNRRSSITKAITRIKLDWNQSKFKAKNQGFAVKKMFLIWHRSAWRYCGKVRSTAFWHVRQKQAKNICVKPLVKCSSSIQFPFSFST